MIKSRIQDGTLILTPDIDEKSNFIARWLASNFGVSRQESISEEEIRYARKPWYHWHINRVKNRSGGDENA